MMNKNNQINPVHAVFPATEAKGIASHTAAEQQYVAPQIEIIDIEMEQNILGGSGTTPDMPGEGW